VTPSRQVLRPRPSTAEPRTGTLQGIGTPAPVAPTEHLVVDGKLTGEEYTKVLAPALAAATKDSGEIRIVLYFTGEFDGLEPGAVWQDGKTGLRDGTAWERIALVTDHAWMRDGAIAWTAATPEQP
jgi:hypothetical protein